MGHNRTSGTDMGEWGGFSFYDLILISIGVVTATALVLVFAQKRKDMARLRRGRTKAVERRFSGLCHGPPKAQNRRHYVRW
ncbi:MAG: hypothetical protein NVSMB6_14420 [Burkholderiaceae bacterium]